jgi:hypothetical protein
MCAGRGVAAPVSFVGRSRSATEIYLCHRDLRLAQKDGIAVAHRAMSSFSVRASGATACECAIS